MIQLDEAETARTTRVAVFDDDRRMNLSVFTKQRLEVTVGDPPRQISNVEFFHC